MSDTSDKDQKTFTLTNDQTGESCKLPVHDGTCGPSVIDVRKLYAETGHFTFDPSFTSTGSCKSRLTFIDGEEGILMHRGYSIEDLANKSSFLELAFLLLYGDLPKPDEMSEFKENITYHTMVHEQLNFFFRGFRHDAHPMAIMCGVVAALSAFYHDSAAALVVDGDPLRDGVVAVFEFDQPRDPAVEPDPAAVLDAAKDEGLPVLKHQ